CAGDVVRAEQAVAEAVTLRGVLRLIGLEIVPQARRERVFGIDLVVRLQDAAELRAIGRKLEALEVESGLLAKTDDEYPLALLRYPRVGTDHPGLDVITEFVLEHVDDRCEGAAFVVPFEVLDVLEHEG